MDKQEKVIEYLKSSLKNIDLNGCIPFALKSIDNKYLTPVEQWKVSMGVYELYKSIEIAIKELEKE